MNRMAGWYVGAHMRSALVVAVVALFGSSCASVVGVTREVRPALSFTAEQQPVQVRASDSGVLIIEVLRVFSASDLRRRTAAADITTTLQSVGYSVTNDTATARSHVVLDVTEDDITTDSQGVKTANVTMWLTQDGVDLNVRIKGTASGNEPDGTLYENAINHGVHQVAELLRATEVLDSYRLEEPEHLYDANKLLLARDFQGAVAAYQARVAQQPDDVAAWLNLSVALVAMGDLHAATDAARHAAAADTTAKKQNRVFYAEDLAHHAAVTTRIVDVWTQSGPKAKEKR